MAVRMIEISILKERISVLGNQLPHFRCQSFGVVQSEHDDVRLSALIYLPDDKGGVITDLNGCFVPAWNDCFHDKKSPTTRRVEKHQASGRCILRVWG